MKKVTLLSIAGLILYGLILLATIPSFSSLAKTTLNFESLAEIFPEENISVALAATSNKAATIQPGDVLGIEREAPESDELSAGVLSTINLRYENEIYLIEPSEVEFMLGNSRSLREAKENFELFGVAGAETMVLELFEGIDQNKRYYQSNRNGILKDQIKGFEYYEDEYGPNTEDAAQEVVRVIKTRLELNSGNQDYITVKSDYHPGTNGEYTEGKYLELDQSKQRMYGWEDGELYKVWDASGFFDEYAVYGVFDVKNKSKNAWSPIAEKWMPYWMAFYWDNKQAAWYGLHELVYWYDGDGNYIEESSDSIGQKKSGGCVRLDRGEMIQLYSWAEVGMHFIIHE